MLNIFCCKYLLSNHGKFGHYLYYASYVIGVNDNIFFCILMIFNKEIIKWIFRRENNKIIISNEHIV